MGAAGGDFFAGLGAGGLVFSAADFGVVFFFLGTLKVVDFFQRITAFKYVGLVADVEILHPLSA